MRTLLALAVVLVLPALPTTVSAQDTTRTVSVGGFVDAYYAWDFERPRSFDRGFTTQPARHDEFNVNLAFIEMKVAAAKLRGRVALQAGTAVQSNYAGEPRIGAISGPELARHIQEAVAGFQVAPRLWVDGGIYFSHIGQEGWISRDNPTYSRSLIADYSPYYETGLKATWQATSKVTAQLHVLNGWQNISETNHSKAVGFRLDVSPSAAVTFGYANFIGEETPDTVPSRTRIFNELFANFGSGKWRAWVTGDQGIQSLPGGGSDSWYGVAAIGKVQIAPKVAIAVRLERYADSHQVIVATGTPDGFQVNGGSLNLDIAPVSGVLWRIELRGFKSNDAIYPSHVSDLSDRDGFLASSLAITL